MSPVLFLLQSSHGKKTKYTLNIAYSIATCMINMEGQRLVHICIEILS
jgi:hypothetical protein